MSTQNDPEFLAKQETEEGKAIEANTARTQKTLMWVMVVIAAIVVCVLVYIYAIRKPGIEAADKAIGQADTALTMSQDSIALVQYKAVADNYGYDAGNRAALNTAIILYRQAQEDTTLRAVNLPEAIKYLEKYDPQESVIGAASQSLMGDCYVNLGQYDKARKCFQKAVKISDNNPAYTPFFMMKEATVCRALGDFASEAALYKAIDEQYPSYAAGQNIDIKKYISRAEAQAQ